MTKNYFTKEQALKIALNTNVPFSSDDTQHIFNTAQIREMMNLAVEAAIGEPYLNVEHGMPQNVRWIKVNDLKNKTPLYSVKELEN